MVDNTEKKDVSRWTDEGGATATARQIRLVDSKLLKGTKLNDESDQKMATGFRIIVRTVLPLLLSVVSVSLAVLTEGSQVYLWSALALLGFAWFALQIAYADEKPMDKNSMLDGR